MYIFNAKIKAIKKENIICHLKRMIEEFEKGKKAYIQGSSKKEEWYYGYYKETK